MVGRSRVVIRTFGDDLDDLVACVNDFAQRKALARVQALLEALEHFHITPDNERKI